MKKKKFEKVEEKDKEELLKPAIVTFRKLAHNIVKVNQFDANRTDDGKYECVIDGLVGESRRRIIYSFTLNPNEKDSKTYNMSDIEIDKINKDIGEDKKKKESVNVVFLKKFQHSKNCRVCVVTEDGYVHMSWDTEDNQVLSFEYIPDNYPAGTYILWNSEDEYEKEIKEIQWIQNFLNKKTASV